VPAKRGPMACLKHIPVRKEDVIEMPHSTITAHKKPDLNEPLGKKSERPDILAKLVQIEQDIIAKARAQGII